jgi:hypothetical protein
MTPTPNSVVTDERLVERLEQHARLNPDVRNLMNEAIAALSQPTRVVTDEKISDLINRLARPINYGWFPHKECEALEVTCMEAINVIRVLSQATGRERKMGEALERVVTDWDALYSPGEVETWLREYMKPAIDNARQVLLFNAHIPIIGTTK